MLTFILQRYLFDYYQVLSIVNTVYYLFILLGIFTGLFFFYRRMLQAGYPKRKVDSFVLMMVIFFFPLGYISSRAGGILHYPLESWSLQLLYNQIVSGTLHTFHACLILPVAFFLLLTVLFRFAEMRVVDMAFMHVPLAHAIGRLGCLSAGCCWGNTLSFTLFGSHFSFTNPVPLYAILANLAIFLVLRRAYSRIYMGGVAQQAASGTLSDQTGLFIRIRELLAWPIDLIRNKGGVVGGYLVLYGAVRFFMEFIRTNKIEAFGLTQPQIVMLVFIMTGTLILLLTQTNPRYSVSSSEVPLELLSSGSKTERKPHSLLLESRTNRYLPLVSYLICMFVFMGTVLYLVRYGYVRWPFTGSARLATVYASIVTYLPLFILAWLSLLWLKWARIPFVKQFGWKKFSNIFFVGIIISAWYSMYLLMRNPVDISRTAVWLPVIILSLLNAFSEEIFYRLTLFELLGKFVRSTLFVNVIQSAAYALPHYFIGGLQFASFAFLYGMLLGLIKEKNESIIPCVVCHFIIDLGSIGAPLLLRSAIYF
ncbi:MAG: prolipoprotein diacylglyceryl transferase [Deltaproteobacteria bacterium]|nr:prolipoprotein diacylglyceryl transferase [Deltaproteobacteria bacterium]